MNESNPTRIEIGMTGEFAGRTYSVVARVVMGMSDGGETYYWNEYGLRTADGHPAILVYEETGTSGEWRLFTYFQPNQPMTLAAAQAITAGNVIDLDGRSMKVTLAADSRVYRIEGQPAEPMQVGDLAPYFNAESGDQMIVVSWLNGRIYYYRGMDLPERAVAAAFGLQRALALPRMQAPESQAGKAVGYGVALVVLGILGLFAYGLFKATHVPTRPSPLVKSPTPPALLKVGDPGRVENQSLKIVGNSLVKIVWTGHIDEEQEYQAADGTGAKVLLVDAPSMPGTRWQFFRETAAPDKLTRESAAALRLGDTLAISGTSFQVDRLFLAAQERSEGDTVNGRLPGTNCFGLHAHSGNAVARVLWDANTLSVQSGKALTDAEVKVAFPATIR